MFLFIILAMVIFSILMSIRTLFIPYQLKEKWVSFENFVYLAFIYITIMIGFGLIYTLLNQNGIIVLSEINHELNDFFDNLQTGIYFSGMTLFSVGYGDITPLGIGRFIAFIEALIGYTIPAAFVARAVMD